MKADDREDFMKAIEKEIKYFTTEDVWEIIPKIIASNFSTNNPINVELQKKKKTIYRANQTQGLFMCTWWYATRRGWFS